MQTKLLFCTLCILLSFTNSNSQSYILYGDKTFGTYGFDFSVSMIKTSDSQLIIAGNTTTNMNGDKTDPKCDPPAQFDSDIWLLKVDTAFNIAWDKSIGGSGSEGVPKLFLRTGTNEIIFSSNSYSDSSCEKSENNRDTISPITYDYWICSIDLNGNKLWDKTLGGTEGDIYPQTLQLESGEYVIAGRSNSPAGADKTATPYVAGEPDYWVVKYDTLGNVLWDKVFGGIGDEQAEDGQPNYDFSIAAAGGGDFILAGTTNSPVSGDISDISRGDYDYWIIKVDSAGGKIWDKRYGGSGRDECNHIIKTNDKGYILCGTTESPIGLDVSDSLKGTSDFWVIKLDSSGNKQWDRSYGGNGGEQGTFIQEAPGGGYWVSGTAGTDSSSFDITEPTYGSSDYWIFKIDNSGNKLWDKRFGGPQIDLGSRFVIMPDTSIFLGGVARPGISPVKTDSGKAVYDYWVVHFKYTDNSTGIKEIANQNNLVSVYPNPAKDIIYINTKNNFTATEINLYDVAGREVMEKKLNKTTFFSVKELNAGIYFYEVKDAKGKTGRGKMVRE